MIITRIQGGLGNQMFQYAIAKSMAKKNDCIFKLDLSQFLRTPVKHETYKLNQFNIEGDIASLNECNALRGVENTFFRVRRRLGFKLNRPKAYMQ